MTDWLWIPLTLWAAFAQTLRNAAQRHLTPIVGTLGATLVRFLYGLPFSALWFVGVYIVSGESMPVPHLDFFAWVLAGSVVQIAATALLLRVMAERNFALGVAYSKTEIVQVAVFGLVFLGDTVTPISAAAVAMATVGLLLISTQTSGASLSGVLKGWTQRTALLGLVSGGCFALAAVAYRCGALALDSTGFTVTVDGRDLPVTLAEFLLLKEFVLNPYRVLDRTTLARALSRRGFGYTTSHLSARTVDLHISHLRKKLHQAGYDCIKTMRFVGYRFVPLVPA